MTAFSRDVDAVARAAGAAILDVARASDVGASAKTDGSPVTAADLASHRLLSGGLPALTPGLPIVSEEDAAGHGLSAGRYWLIDPLDGTREFLAGTGEYCVCLAIIDDGRPIYGLIHVPVTGESYYAAADSGTAFRLDAPDAPPAVLRPRYGVELARAGLRVGVSRRHRGPATAAFLGRLRAPAPVPMGSAIKFCAIAAGTLDLYVRHGRTMHWDTAAGQCLLEAVGLGVYRLDTGAPLRYDTPTRTNPGFLAGPCPS